MTDLRTRIAAVVNTHEWHSDGTGEGQCDCDGRWFKNKRLYDFHLADAVIRELGLQPHLAKRIINGKPDQRVRRFTTDWEIVDD